MNGGSSKNEQTSSNYTRNDPAQAQYLQSLWAGATGAQASGAGGYDANGANSFISQLQNPAYAQSFQNFMQPNNQMAQQQIGILGKNLSDQFNNQINPAIGSSAQMSGQFGGGRQGVAQGMAIQGMQNAFGQGSAQIQNNAYNQALNATQMGSQYNNANAIAGLQGMGMRSNLAFSPYLNLAQILGAPVMTTTGEGRTTGSNFQGEFK